MHLMYYLDEQGVRVYTLKAWASPSRRLQALAQHHMREAHLFPFTYQPAHIRAAQKETPSGKPTESAHPGAARPRKHCRISPRDTN